jgi:putative Holliday junction resolvase
MRVLAVDPGEKHIGLALSDPSGTVARPLITLEHESRARDAERILTLAAEHSAEVIVVGLALDADDRLGPQARRAARLVDALQARTSLRVVTHDESHTTAAAQQAMRATGKTKRARRDDLHAVAAAALLQSYLDARPRDDQTA